MKTAVGFGPVNDDWEQAASWVLEAEKLGVDFAFSGEAWGYDAATSLAFIASRTSRIQIGSGIMQLPARTPANLAMIAMSLASISNDRFVLGLGMSGPQVVEGWYGVRFQPALTRIRETVAIVRQIARGERLHFKGDMFEFPLPDSEGRALKTGAPPREIPIYLATLGQKTLELTGEIADGWIASSFMPDHADALFQHMARGAAKVGKTLADLDLHGGGVVAFSDDLDKLITPRKPGFAFEMGAMGSPRHNFYTRAYKMQGYEEVATKVQSLWLEGKREEAAALIPDDFVIKANLLGTDEMVKERIRVYRDAGITTIHAAPSGNTFGERLETLGRFMDLIAEVNGETPAPA